MLTCFPPASTCTPALTANGARVYNHLATKKLPTHQAHSSKANDETSKRVGTRARRARPIQKSEKMTAAPRADATQLTEKATNRKSGRDENRPWATRRDLTWYHQSWQDAEMGVRSFVSRGARTKRTGRAEANAETSWYARWRDEGGMSRSRERWAREYAPDASSSTAAVTSRSGWL